MAGACASVLRPSDTVARLGGDEFAVLVEDLAEPHGATSVAERILLRALAPGRRSAGAGSSSSASVGVAVSGGDLSDADELVRAADLAMYAAKGGGKGRYRSFEPSMLAGTVERLALARRPAARDRAATSSSSTTSRWSTWAAAALRGVEALARWTHPRARAGRRPTSSSRSPSRAA